MVAGKEEVHSLEALRCSELDFRVLWIHACLHVKLHVLKPTGAVLEEALCHGETAPDALPAEGTEAPISSSDQHIRAMSSSVDLLKGA